MPAKCNGCGRYLAVTGGVACCSCRYVWHRACVNLAPGSIIPRRWVCFTCNTLRSRSSIAPQERARRTLIAPVARQMEETRADEACALGPMTQLAREMRAFAEELRQVKDEAVVRRREALDLSSIVASMDDRMNRLDERMTAIEDYLSSTTRPATSSEEINMLEAAVIQLRLDLDERDQQHLLNDVDIIGIPEEEGENVDQLVILYAAKLGVEINSRDLVKASRMGAARAEGARPRVICVRLARHALRNELLKAARTRRNTTTEGLGLRSRPRMVYINEKLTRSNRNLFNMARDMAHKAKWRFVWTRYGRVFVRREDRSPAYRVKNYADLKRILGTEDDEDST